MRFLLLGCNYNGMNHNYPLIMRLEKGIIRFGGLIQKKIYLHEISISFDNNEGIIPALHLSDKNNQVQIYGFNTKKIHKAFRERIKL